MSYSTLNGDDLPYKDAFHDLSEIINCVNNRLKELDSSYNETDDNLTENEIDKCNDENDSRSNECESGSAIDDNNDDICASKSDVPNQSISDDPLLNTDNESNCGLINNSQDMGVTLDILDPLNLNKSKSTDIDAALLRLKSRSINRELRQMRCQTIAAIPMRTVTSPNVISRRLNMACFPLEEEPTEYFSNTSLASETSEETCLVPNDRLKAESLGNGLQNIQELHSEVSILKKPPKLVRSQSENLGSKSVRFDDK